MSQSTSEVVVQLLSLVVNVCLFTRFSFISRGLHLADLKQRLSVTMLSEFNENKVFRLDFISQQHRDELKRVS